MRASSNYSRRRFLHAGTAGVAATVVAATTTPVRAAAEAGIQTAPPTATAPRILRKPPLPELQRIAKSYNLDLSRDDLTSFRNLMDGVLASYRRLDQFAEPTLAVKYPRDRGSVHPPRTIRSTLGTGGARSKAQRRELSRARKSPSKTMCASPASR
jgi:amidase